MSIRQARSLRKKATDPEKRLWSSLRDRKVAGLKFRRQHPVGDRIVDFFCAEVKLEIELYEQGVRILRFPNQDVVDNLDGVLNAIIYAVDPDKSLWSYRPAKEAEFSRGRL